MSLNLIYRSTGSIGSIDFEKKVKSLFFRKRKIQKIFSRILKIFFILEFEKKSVTFFSDKTFFGKNFCRKSDFHYKSQHTHIKTCVCVDKKSTFFENFKLKAVCFAKKEMKLRVENRFRLKAV